MRSNDRRNNQFMIGLPALILVLFVQIPTLYRAIVLPFINYEIFKGYGDSSFVGLRNFEQVLSEVYFWPLITNTLLFNITISLLVMIIAFFVGWGLYYTKSEVIKVVISGLLIIPFLIPGTYWNALLFKLYGSGGWLAFQSETLPPLLTNGAFLRSQYILMESFRLGGIGAVWVAFVIRYRSPDNIIANGLKAAVIYCLGVFSLGIVSDFEILNGLTNPLVYRMTDTLTTFAYRVSLMSSQYATGGVVWLLQAIWMLILLSITGLLFRLLFKNDLGHRVVRNVDRYMVPPIASRVVLWLYSLIVMAVVIMIGVVYLLTLNQYDLSLLYVVSLPQSLLAVISTVICIGLAIFLAYPMTVLKGAPKVVYAALMILLVATAHFGSQEFLMIKDLGLINTYYSVVVGNLFNPIYVVIIAVYYKIKENGNEESFARYVGNSMPLILALLIVTFFIHQDSFMGNLLYLGNDEIVGGSVKFMRILQNIGLN